MNSEHTKMVQHFLTHVYKDRGMMKWQGFYLSDHTSSLAKTKNESAAKYRLTHQTIMTADAIQTVINQAVKKRIAVSVDLAQRDQDGLLLAPVEGYIEGYVDDKIVVGKTLIALENIFAIQLLTK